MASFRLGKVLKRIDLLSADTPVDAAAMLLDLSTQGSTRPMLNPRQKWIDLGGVTLKPFHECLSVDVGFARKRPNRCVAAKYRKVPLGDKVQRSKVQPIRSTCH